MKFALAQMEVRAGVPERNIRVMLEMIGKAKKERVDLIAFPELCISGYFLSDQWLNESFCEDLMRYNDILLEESRGIAIAYGNIYLDKETGKRWKDAKPHPNKDGRTRKYNAVYIAQNGKWAERIAPPPAPPQMGRGEMHTLPLWDRWINHILPEGIQPKTLLPDYRIYDDERYFFSLQDVAKERGVPLESLTRPFLIETGKKKIPVGFEICEDLWCGDYLKEGCPINPTQMLIGNGAKLIVNISASPWNYGKNSARDKRVFFLSSEGGSASGGKKESGKIFVPFLYVNNTGTQNNGKNIITFDGGTTVYNRKGRPVLFSSQIFKSDFLIFSEAVFGKPSLKRKNGQRIRQKFDAIVEGIRHFNQHIPPGQPLQFVTGLSGGIDSAVVASLLAIACGKENVHAVNMPSRFNSEKTKRTAQEIANRLGIEYLIIPIDPFSDQYNKLFSGLDKKYVPPEQTRALSDENIQAKVRGTNILSTLAGRYGWLLTNNGNKLEIALGYATLYGDVNGAIAPIGDLTKTEVYELGKFLNKEIFRKEVIPEILFPDDLFRFSGDKIAPTAELKSNQTDPMKFGYHCALLNAFTDYLRKTPEDVMGWYLEGSLEKNLDIRSGLIQRWGIDDPGEFMRDLKWFVSSMQKSVFKRIQSPPIIITSRSSFGYDNRESMLPFEPTIRYRELKDKILKMKKYEGRKAYKNMKTLGTKNQFIK